MFENWEDLDILKAIGELGKDLREDKSQNKAL